MMHYLLVNNTSEYHTEVFKELLKMNWIVHLIIKKRDFTHIH